jgi:hypothetical protein
MEAGNRKRLVILAGAVAFVLLIVALVVGACWGTRQQFVDGVLGGAAGAAAGAVITLVLVWVAMEQLEGIDETSQRSASIASADFVLRLSEQYFQDQTRILIHLVDADYLQFKRDANLAESYFEVDTARVEKSTLHVDVKQALTKRRIYSTYDMDHFLLGVLEDLGFYEQARILDVSMIYNNFSWYIEIATANPAVKEYVEASRAEDPSVWAQLDYILKQCREFEAIQNRKP